MLLWASIILLFVLEHCLKTLFFYPFHLCVFSWSMVLLISSNWIIAWNSVSIIDTLIPLFFPKQVKKFSSANLPSHDQDWLSIVWLSCRHVRYKKWREQKRIHFSSRRFSQPPFWSEKKKQKVKEIFRFDNRLVITSLNKKLITFPNWK